MRYSPSLFAALAQLIIQGRAPAGADVNERANRPEPVVDEAARARARAKHAAKLARRREKWERR